MFRLWEGRIYTPGIIVIALMSLMVCKYKCQKFKPLSALLEFTSLTRPSGPASGEKLAGIQLSRMKFN